MTTQYLVDELNPTGYLQVMDEVSGGAVQVRYTYGNMLVSQTRIPSTSPATSFYGYDAHRQHRLPDGRHRRRDGHVRLRRLGQPRGASTGRRPTLGSIAGEEFDPDLGLINLRAREYNAGTGRFLTIDPYIGNFAVPLSFNRYLYTTEDPVNRLDPSGRTEFAETLGILVTGTAILNGAVLGTAYAISKYASDPIIRSAASNTVQIAEHLAVFVPVLPVASIYAIGNLGACMILLEVDGYYENFNPNQPPPEPCLVTP